MNDIYEINTSREIRRGVQAGLIYLIIILPHLLQSLLIGVSENQTPLLIVGVVLAIVADITYILLLVGVQALAKELRAERLVQNLQAGIIITAFMLPINSLGSVFGNFSRVAAMSSLVASLIVMILYGIISIRLATDFKRLEGQLGASAHVISRWQKISGYLMVTVLFSVIGALLSLIADYHMWRLLKNRMKIIHDEIGTK